MGYIDNIVYDSKGHTGSTYYARIIQQSTGYIWDDSSNKELAASPTWEDSVVDLVEVGETGEFPFRVPEDLPDDNYDVIVYKQAGTDPLKTDDVEQSFTLKKGSIFGF